MVAAFALTLTVPSHAADPPRSVGHCAELLPEGTTYTFTVEGKVERGAKKATVTTNISVSGESDMADPKVFDKDTGPFHECLKKLVAG